jgi:GDP-L-fucose synthase
MEKTKKIYIAGHRGMVGSALTRKLRAEGFTNFVTRTSRELDLRNQQAVNDFFQAEKPNYVFLAAAKVGGILANNTYRAEFIYDNIMMEANVINAAHQSGVEKLLFMGSSCIYPKLAPQPLKEEYLLTGLLEPTNEPYAIAKIAGIKMCDAYRAQYGSNFISVMPTNLYGPNDNYDLEKSHVLPALLRKFHEAKINDTPSVVMWGTGSPKREFLHVDDLAEACYYLMENYNEQGLVNIGTGEDVAIIELANMIKKVVGYKGKIEHDLTKPDGTPRKLMNVEKLERLGWKAKTSLEDGIQSVYEAVDKVEWGTNMEFDKKLSKETLFSNTRSLIDRLGFSVEKYDDARPWGGFFVLPEEDAPRFIQYFFPNMNMDDFKGYAKLSPKILLVAPDKRLSWQYHHRRAELWRVVGGTAGVVVSDTDEQTEPKALSLGEIIQLKQGERHRLIGTDGWGMVAEIWKHTNPEYPSDEDDIVRVQDDFGR